MISRVLIVEQTSQDEYDLPKEFISEQSSKGIIVVHKNQQTTADILEIAESLWNFPSGTIARCSNPTNVSLVASQRPQDAVLVIMHTIPFSNCKDEFKTSFRTRIETALSLGAHPSFLTRGKQLDDALSTVQTDPIAETISKIEDISIIEIIGGERVRHDRIKMLDPTHVLRNGCIGIIRPDQLYKELLYILDKAPKYGA